MLKTSETSLKNSTIPRNFMVINRPFSSTIPTIPVSRLSVKNCSYGLLCAVPKVFRVSIVNLPASVAINVKEDHRGIHHPQKCQRKGKQDQKQVENQYKRQYRYDINYVHYEGASATLETRVVVSKIIK